MTRCEKIIYSGTWATPSRCSKSATILRDGKHYCKIHDPVYVADKHRTQQEKWDLNYAKSKARYEEESRALTLLPLHEEMLSALKECVGIIANEIELTETACKGLDEARAIIKKCEAKP